MADGVTTRGVVRYHETVEQVSDALVVEEPMEIRLEGVPLAVVMRTPGQDAALALGFAITEGVVTGPQDVSAVRDLGEGRYELVLADGVSVDPARFQRNFYTTSSCGVCGKASIDAIRVTGSYPPPGPTIDREVIMALPGQLYEHQVAFHRTGGLHAAAGFLADGSILGVCEDVGRHNSVDKLVGRLARESWPLSPMGLMISGRLSFEIVQKAAVAGMSLVCGVSAASSLGVELAEEFGMTLIGFLRDDGFTVYTDNGRLDEAGGESA